MLVKQPASLLTERFCSQVQSHPKLLLAPVWALPSSLNSKTFAPAFRSSVPFTWITGGASPPAQPWVSAEFEPWPEKWEASDLSTMPKLPICRSYFWSRKWQFFCDRSPINIDLSSSPPWRVEIGSCPFGVQRERESVVSAINLFVCVVVQAEEILTRVV